MAGSYGHITDADGSFRGIDLIWDLGDAYEALEMCHGMISILAGGDQDVIHQAGEQWFAARRAEYRA